MRLDRAENGQRIDWEYRPWEFDPTWPDADLGPEVGPWVRRDVLQGMWEAALEDSPRLPNRIYRIQRRMVMYSEAEPECLDELPERAEEIEAARAFLAADPASASG